MVPADNCAGSTVGAGILDISQEGQDPREQCVKKLCRGWMVEHLILGHILVNTVE